MTRLLITGIAGFIGFHFARWAMSQGDVTVIGIDNMSDYYSVVLKEDRLTVLGFVNEEKSVSRNGRHIFYKVDLKDTEIVTTIFEKYRPSHVVHLAAQAGVRYSIRHPEKYMESNINGFFNVLDLSRRYNIEHFIYASSSSVYGANDTLPFSTDDRVDQPISFYAASKKTNELFAHSYSHIYQMKTTGLRFFTAYGPWTRPDMALYHFASQIVDGKPIQIFNHGQMSRDFTYVDDVVKCISTSLHWTHSSGQLYSIFNVARGKSTPLMSYVQELEKAMNTSAIIEYVELQMGDMVETFADISGTQKELSYIPSVDIDVGIREFVNWFYTHYKKYE